MRVITLHEPWASLIGENIKISETRSWPCYQYGELYIHAGQMPIPKNDTRKNELSKLLSGSLHHGTIFAKCILSDCILIDEQFANAVKEDNLNNYLCGDYTPGRYAWILTNIEPITPIKATGKQGIWYFNPDNLY